MIQKYLVLKLALGITLLFISGIFPVFGQIGVNTENISPGLVLHIDPARNNPSSGTPIAAQTAEDIVINQTGNVGIGTINPQTKLHIVTGGTAVSPNPQIKIEDGGQFEDKVFTSDAQGAGRWFDYAAGAVLGTFDPTGVNINLPTTNLPTYFNTKSKISLPPGRWVILYTFVVNSNVSLPNATAGTRVWVDSTIGDLSTLNGSQTTGTPSLDIEGVQTFGGLVFVDHMGILTGRCTVNNTSGVAKDYYCLVGNTVNYSSRAGVMLMNVGGLADNNSLFAFRFSF